MGNSTRWNALPRGCYHIPVAAGTLVWISSKWRAVATSHLSANGSSAACACVVRTECSAEERVCVCMCRNVELSEQSRDQSLKIRPLADCAPCSACAPQLLFGTMLQHVIVRNTFWTLVAEDRSCRLRSQSCPPEFFVDQVIQRAIRREKRREKRRVLKEQNARDHETFEFYGGVVANEKLEAHEPAPVETKRSRGRIAEMRRRKEAETAKKYDIELRDDERPRVDACLTLLTGHGMYCIDYGACATTTQLRNLLLDANGFSRSSDFVVRTAEFKLVPPDKELRACDVLPGMCVHLGARKEKTRVCIGRA